MTSIDIPYGVTSIGRAAFNGCDKLAAITIPSTVTSIGDAAFLACSGLTSIKTYIKNVFKTGERTFTNCPKATLYVPQGLVDVYRATEDWNTISNIEEMPVIHDVNGDGLISLSDIVCLIDKILGLSSDESYSYDINNDGIITIADIASLIDAILEH